MIKVMFGREALAGGWRVGVVERACKWEAEPGRLVPVRFCRPLPLHSAPAVTLTGGLPVLLGFGESYSYLPFGNSICPCGSGPTDMLKSVSFFVLAILKVSFGKIGEI